MSSAETPAEKVEEKTEDKPDFTPYRTAAEGILSQAWGRPVHLGEAEGLREGGRNRVARCPVLTQPTGAPPVTSVIIKASVGEGDAPFNPDDETPGGAAFRFSNEWAGSDLIGSLPVDPPLGARLFGADRATGVVVTEDLGAGASLADRMQADDRAGLDSALLAYARGMGRLHAATVGREPGYRERQLARMGFSPSPDREGTELVRDAIPKFKEQCEALGVALAEGFDDEIAQVQTQLDDPGPFLAFAPGDTCPDNHRLVGEEGICFFDFEFCGFRHALLDASYLRMPFPTCWCVNRLPSERVTRLESAYRAELSAGCPEASDDALFYPAMAAACAYWAIVSVHWSLPMALKEDGQWGISTHRQRHPVRLANFADLTEAHGLYPALTATCRALEAKLRTLWADVDPMPLYPAFREKAG